MEGDVPVFLKMCGEYVSQHLSEGIFRIPGDRLICESMRKKIEKREDFIECNTNGKSNDNSIVYSIASLMQMFLKELPEPLIPYDNYNNFRSNLLYIF